MAPARVAGSLQRSTYHSEEAGANRGGLHSVWKGMSWQGGPHPLGQWGSSCCLNSGYSKDTQLMQMLVRCSRCIGHLPLRQPYPGGVEHVSRCYFRKKKLTLFFLSMQEADQVPAAVPWELVELLMTK